MAMMSDTDREQCSLLIIAMTTLQLRATALYRQMRLCASKIPITILCMALTDGIVYPPRSARHVQYMQVRRRKYNQNHSANAIPEKSHIRRIANMRA